MIDPIVLEKPSSSSTTPFSGYRSGHHSSAGGRAIDRHNPIIRDEKRLGRPQIILPNSASTVTGHRKKKNSNGTTKKTPTPAPEESGDQKRKSIVFSDEESITSPAGGFISPASSSRFLLSHKATSSFSPEFGLVPAPAPHEPSMSLRKKDDDIVFSAPAKSPPCETPKFQYSKPEASPLPPPCEPFKKDHQPPPSPRSSDQVVVLEVSLHCRGCERKMRKHISKIEGVKSFKIEFTDKKVTVVGDVTPLAVLTSVLKVKNAKLLTPATISSSTNHLFTDVINIIDKKK